MILGYTRSEPRPSLHRFAPLYLNGGEIGVPWLTISADCCRRCLRRQADRQLKMGSDALSNPPQPKHTGDCVSASLRLAQQTQHQLNHLYSVGRRWRKGNNMESLSNPPLPCNVQELAGWLIVHYPGHGTRSENYGKMRYQSPKSRVLPQAAVSALGQPNWLGKLQHLLQSTQPRVREAGILQLAWSGCFLWLPGACGLNVTTALAPRNVEPSVLSAEFFSISSSIRHTSMSPPIFESLHPSISQSASHTILRPRIFAIV